MKTTSMAIGILALLTIGLIAYGSANQVDDKPKKENPLLGKVVLLTQSPGTTPKENVRIEDLGGKAFLVYQVERGDGQSFEIWTAINDISLLLVFDSMEDAEAYGKK